MKKMVLAAALLLISPLAFAGTGSSSLSCNVGDEIVALYSVFNSVADSYSTVTVFVRDQNSGKFIQYDAANTEALKPLAVKLKDGRKLTISADIQQGECNIK